MVKYIKEDSDDIPPKSIILKIKMWKYAYILSTAYTSISKKKKILC